MITADIARQNVKQRKTVVNLNDCLDFIDKASSLGLIMVRLTRVTEYAKAVLYDLGFALVDIEGETVITWEEFEDDGS